MDLMTKDQQGQKNGFLPNDYVRPDRRKQFMKFKEGKNPFRVLSPALLGWVIFDKDGMPHRKQFGEPFTEDELLEIQPRKNDDGTEQLPRHFWVFFVWCYNTESIKVLDIGQVSIMKGMEGYFDNEHYGEDPTKYDFVVVRTGTGKTDTEYGVMANPQKPLPKKITDVIETFQDKADLNALMVGEYPFKEYTFDN